MNTQYQVKIKKITLVLLLLAGLLLTILTGCGGEASQGRLLLKVNPEISIDYNEEGKVLAVTGENDDGKAIVAEYDDFLGKSSKVVVGELVKILDDHGYLEPTIDHQPREITLSVTSDSVLPEDDFLETIAQEVTASTAQAPMVTVVGQDGQKHTQELLSGEQALATALAHAGTSNEDAQHVEIQQDDDHYEIDFVVHGTLYSYEVNRSSGKIESFSSRIWDKESVLEHGAPDYITLQQVQEIILADLATTADHIVLAKTELELENEQPYYEIDVYYNDTKIEYHLNAYDGSILKKEEEPADSTPKKQETDTTNPAQKQDSSTTDDTGTHSGATSDSSKRLTVEEAKAVVLKHAGVSADQAFFEEVELDLDDGRWEYEIEFHAGGIEYEYDIDAYTGAVLSLEKEQKSSGGGGTASQATPSQDSSSKEKSLISLDQAVNIALQHAGYSASQVSFDDRELDWEDGRPIYEIEFDVGDLEYEYDIDGYTGQIISYEIDD